MKYSYDRSTERPPRKWPILLVIVVLVLVAAGGGLALYKRQQPVAQKTTPVASVVKSALPTYKTVVGNYLFSGTVMMGRAVEKLNGGNYEQPFSGMSTLGTYDARTGTLECPVTGNTVSYQEQIDKLIFNCRPEGLPALKKYFPIVNVSSNHMYDQGQAGFDETVSRLKAAGFQVVGNYNPHIEKDDCKAVIWPVRLQKTNGQEDTASLPVAYCSYNYKTLFSPAPGELESIKTWSNLMPVVALMNGGPEYEHQAGVDQTNVAHKMIDEGADFVVGNGTHWVQNTEVYKGKLIIYSMGNFIFDQLDYDGRIAFNLSTSMKLSYDTNVSKWLQLGSDCKSATDTCMQLAQQRGLKRYNPTYDFNAIGSYGGYQLVATKATPQQQTDIETRANWSQTQHLLQAN